MDELALNTATAVGAIPAGLATAGSIKGREGVTDVRPLEHPGEKPGKSRLHTVKHLLSRASPTGWVAETEKHPKAARLWDGADGSD